MAQATNTTLGEIVLAGDLFGNDATAPQLRASGVTPGTYTVLSRASIDSKGRLVSIGALTAADLPNIPDATTSSKGLVQVGAGLTVTGGVVSVPESSSLSKGIASIAATSPTTSWIQVNSGVITMGTSSGTVLDATTGVKGLVSAGSGVVISGGVLSLPAADDSSTFGVVRLGDAFRTDLSAGLTAMVRASSPAQENGAMTAGVIRAGTNIAVAGDGTMSCTAPDATTGAVGLVQIGSNLSVTDGVLSYVGSGVATTGAAGIVRVGNGLAVAGDGLLSVADAGASSKGLIQVGSGLAVSSGVLSLSAPDASSTTKGVVQVGSGLTVSAGLLSCVLPNASGSTFGGIIPGSGLAISADSIISTSLPDATTSTPGVLRVNYTANGTLLQIVNGVLQIADAGYGVSGYPGSASYQRLNPGLVTVGTDLSVASGVVSVTPNTFGRLSGGNTFTGTQSGANSVGYLQGGASDWVYVSGNRGSCSVYNNTVKLIYIADRSWFSETMASPPITQTTNHAACRIAVGGGTTAGSASVLLFRAGWAPMAAPRPSDYYNIGPVLYEGSALPTVYVADPNNYNPGHTYYQIPIPSTTAWSGFLLLDIVNISGTYHVVLRFESNF